jgi:hypothetical protein
MIDIPVEDITSVEQLTDLVQLGQMADLMTLGTTSPETTEPEHEAT